MMNLTEKLSKYYWSFISTPISELNFVYVGSVNSIESVKIFNDNSIFVKYFNYDNYEYFNFNYEPIEFDNIVECLIERLGSRVEKIKTYNLNHLELGIYDIKDEYIGVCLDEQYSEIYKNEGSLYYEILEFVRIYDIMDLIED